jgi:DNA polymerase V
MIVPDPDRPLLMNSPIKAGFPNPAEEAGGFALDLNQYLVKRPVSTYYLRVEGDSMTGAGITPGDIVVVDKALEPRSGDIVVAAVDGDFTLKRLKKQDGGAWLIAEHPGYPPIALHEVADAALWGVVTFVIHRARG